MKRNIVTGMNESWLVGHCEENRDGEWKRLPHSEWVFSRALTYSADGTPILQSPSEVESCYFEGFDGEIVKDIERRIIHE